MSCQSLESSLPQVSFLRWVLTLAEELGVAVGEEVDDGGRVGLGAADVLVPGLGGDEGPAAEI